MVTYEIRSHVGGRAQNEDFAAVKAVEPHYSFALADGLGGHGKGEVASRLAVEAALKAFDGTVSADSMASGFERAQEAVMEEQRRQNAFAQMKTTLTLLEIGGERSLWGHVGDSRVYYFCRKRLVERTLDHSVPQMLVQAGELREREIRHHEDRNRLLRVIGVPWERKNYEIGEPVGRRERQAFLMCTDGWWEWIEEKQMVHCLKRAEHVADWLDRMERIIRDQAGGAEMDNYSAIGVFLE